MKRIFYVILSAFLIMLISFPIASGQEKKNEQRIKIVVSENDSAKILLDTLITGKTRSDSIILKNGKTIYLTKSDGDNFAGTKGTRSYVITTTTGDDDKRKDVKKEIRIISSDSETMNENGNEGCKHSDCESLASGKTYSYTIVSDDKKETNSEETKYVISRNGLRITVEGSDYDKVKEFTKEIEKTLDSKSPTK